MENIKILKTVIVNEETISLIQEKDFILGGYKALIPSIVNDTYNLYESTKEQSDVYKQFIEEYKDAFIQYNLTSCEIQKLLCPELSNVDGLMMKAYYGSGTLEFYVNVGCNSCQST